MRLLVVLMLLEVECHTVPHLKALTCGIEHISGHGSTFTLQETSLKSTHCASLTGETEVSFDCICIT